MEIIKNFFLIFIPLILIESLSQFIILNKGEKRYSIVFRPFVNQIDYFTGTVEYEVNWDYKNNKMTLAMFPKGSGLGDTKAKSTIWENWTKFKNAVDASVRESTKLVKVAEIGDMNAFAKQVRATGKTCRGCHQSFRERN